jgi:predicted transcriptional regulator
MNEDEQTFKPPMRRIRQTVDANTGEVLFSENIDGNKDFTQVYGLFWPVIKQFIKTDRKRALVLCAVIEHMNKGNAVVISQRTLAEITGLSLGSVCTALRLLEKENIVKKLRVGNIPVLHVNANLAWTTHANGRRYAALTAEVILSENEQVKPRPKMLKTVSLPKSSIAIEHPGQQVIPGTENL